MDDIGPDETLDAILGGRVSVIQPRRGYRFSVDAVLLARFAHARRTDRVLELGAGSGVVALLIHELYTPREIVAVEIQPALAKLIERNARLNRAPRLRAVCADIRARHIDRVEPQRFDVVLASPPYRAAHAGRQSPAEGRRIGRSEEAATLEQFVRAARRYLNGGGRAFFVHWAPRAAELLSAMRAVGLEPKRIRLVHARLDAPASSVLVEARAGGKAGMRVEAPLVLYRSEGAYTPEASAMLGRARRHR
jgi:tRNA1Val (adenine37-N6)-methyltransferase